MSEELNPLLDWHWSTSDEGPMVSCGTEDVSEGLQHALYESGIATYGEDQTTIFMCRFRPAKINWKCHAERLLESVDEECCDVDGRDIVFTGSTDSAALEKALAEIIKVDALVAYDECEFSPGNEKYETALLRVRNDAAAPTEQK